MVSPVRVFRPFFLVERTLSLALALDLSRGSLC